MEYPIDIARLYWGKRNGRLPPDDSDGEHDADVPVLVRRMRRKSYYARNPCEEDAPYAPAIPRKKLNARKYDVPVY